VTGKRRSLLAFLASNRRQILAMGLTGACLLWGSWTTHKLLGLEQRVTTIRKVALADLVRTMSRPRPAAAPHLTRSRRKPAPTSRRSTSRSPATRRKAKSCC
jgi:hypothetical protein